MTTTSTASTTLSVVIIDDNPDDAEALSRDLTKLDGYEFTIDHYADSASGLQAVRDDPADLVFLDYRLNNEDQDGLELLARSEQAETGVPFIMLTGHGDEYVATETMRAGAADYLVKGKCNLERLKNAIQRVLRESRAKRREQRVRSETRQRLATLTERERDVIEKLIAGKTSKEIAREFHRSEQTIKIHRANLMKKMGASTPAALARMVMAARKPSRS